MLIYPAQINLHKFDQSLYSNNLELYIVQEESMTKGDNGFIKLYRSIMDWGWYCDSNTARLFIHCLLKANYTEKEWQGVTIPIGSFVTSYEKLAQELNLTKKEVRTALNHLKMSHELAHESTSQYSIITVINYVKYQTWGTQNGTQWALEGQTTGTQRATTNKEKKGRKKEYQDRSKIFEELKEIYKESGKL